MEPDEALPAKKLPPAAAVEAPAPQPMARDLELHVMDDMGMRASPEARRWSTQKGYERSVGGRVSACSLNGLWRHHDALGATCFVGCDGCLLQCCCSRGVPGAACYARAGRHRFACPCSSCTLIPASASEVTCQWFGAHEKMGRVC